MFPANTSSDPVLLCNDLGIDRLQPRGMANESSGHGSMSVKEAVRIAQSNNFMGLICHSRLLVRPSLMRCIQSRKDHELTSPQQMVPSLIESIKIAGLVLVSDTSEEQAPNPPITSLSHTYRMPEGVNGIFRSNGLLRFNEMIDM